MKQILDADCLSFVWSHWKEKYDSNFLKTKEAYIELKAFPPDGNIWESGQEIDDELLFFIRLVTQYYLSLAFEGMLIDLDDPNVAENISEGNIGSAARLAKIFCGSNINDDREMGSGRFAKKPRLAYFPNDNGSSIPITKKIDITASCSHHLIAFSSITNPDSYAVISYIPNERVLGISKLQRVANWISQRYWLQENLTKALYDEISTVAETKSVYVCLYAIEHGCEKFRGAKSKDGSMTTEYYGGKFETNPKLRPNV